LGDPSLYSTFTYVVKALKEVSPETEVVSIPGVTSFCAAAAAAGQPLAEKDDPLLILPAGGPGLLEDGLAGGANVVLMKISRGFGTVLDLLKKHDRMEESVLVSRCGRPGQFITRDLAGLQGKRMDYFSLIISKKPGRGC
jgi:precorrin-2/cobalt-factor-2 C20-methyltransferase